MKKRAALWLADTRALPGIGPARSSEDRSAAGRLSRVMPACQLLLP